MTRKRRTFEPRLELEVVRMIIEQGLSVQHVSESVDIGPSATGAGQSSMAPRRMGDLLRQ